MKSTKTVNFDGVYIILKETQNTNHDKNNNGTETNLISKKIIHHHPFYCHPKYFFGSCPSKSFVALPPTHY